MTDPAAPRAYKYVIIGAGNAAGYAARRYVQLDAPQQELCIVGEESVLPYERPALSKAVLINSKVRLPGFHTSVGDGGERQTQEWYQSHGIDTVLEKKVVSLNVAAKRAELDDGSSIQATEALIVATGASPIRLTRTPGNDLSGVCYLRSYQEALSLYDSLQANVGKPVVIIGGGYIGMEVAAAAITVGCEVTMVFPETHMMSRLFTKEIAEPYEAFYKGKGVTFVKNGAIGKAFLSDASGNAVGAVRVAREGEPDMDIPASLVVVGVGARPESSLLADQVNMDSSGGVLVNASLETSVKGVYAIGDIATFPLKMYSGHQVRMEHVQNCREMAAHVVNAAVNGDDSAYDYLPYFYSRVFQLSWQFFGDNDGECSIVSEFDGQALLDAAEGDGAHPQMIAIWTDESSVLLGVFMESPSGDDTDNMKSIARAFPCVDVAAFKACGSVADAWEVLL